MRSYFAGTVQPTFPLRADLRPQRPSAPDFVCGPLCKFGSNSVGEGGTFLLLNSSRVETLSHLVFYLKTLVLLTVSIGSVFLPEGD